ncbi:uncharacterized protein K02A2.6-like [Photinus pyralis]|uniref:uncharacterized protein K02A2.6-like n=1 Tax=Photinus pyralis TaxID=7054 RepID=UPI0012674772|nr:uncharacterized protein K02A2.6-like [Photinus pyralis]
MKVRQQKQQANQVEEIFTLQTEHTTFREKFLLTLKLNGTLVEFEVDSGAAVSIINVTQFKQLFPNIQVENTNLQLVTYCKRELDVVGFVSVTVTYNTVQKILNLYIVKSDRKPLLGREWIRQLQLDLATISHVSLETCPNTLDKVIQKYQSVFEQNMGKIKHLQAKLQVKEGATPIFVKARKVPYALLPKVEEELQILEKEGVLIKVNTSEWATPIVPVVKSNGRIRICGDFKITLNKNLIVDEHPLPTVEELFLSLAGGDKFTKLDLQQAYLQLEVCPEDRKYLTLSTPKGLYQSTRLMFGIASAPAIWQRTIETILQDIDGVTVFLDDIKITAPNNTIHFQRLELVLGRLAKYNIRVNLSKCEFLKDKIEYCGYVIDKVGIHKSKAKIEAIQKVKIPTNKTELRAFAGLVNYYGRFMQNLSSTLHPLYKLLKKDIPFKWNKECQKAFEIVKSQIQSPKVLVHFDPKLPLVLATDASPYAVGAVLSHTFPDGSERPICFASQTLTTVQQKYAQIDKEAYSIVYGVKKFFYYLFGRNFTLYTDHKPLVHIFSPVASLPSLTATRMQHYALFLQGFKYNIKYKNTTKHANADAMSRLPTKSTDNYLYDEPDAFEINQIETLPIKLQELAKATERDNALIPLLKGLQSGTEVDKKFRFNVDQSEFTLQSGSIFRQHRVVVPKTLQYKILQELHATHFGVAKMKALARSYVWWAGISDDIEAIVKNCVNCQKHKNDPVKVQVHPWEPASAPFDRVHVDFAGPFYNRYYFILVDAYTRWPEIHVVKDMTTTNTIALCRKIFTTFGIPRTLVSDNGSTFTSYEFKRFLQENGIIHKLSAPYHPSTNGLAERYVQSFKQALRAMKGHANDCERELLKFLLHYRKTEHSVTKVSPSYLMFGREIRSRLDFLKPDLEVNTKPSYNIRVREISVGKRVAVRDYNHSNKWEFGRIQKRLGKLHYLIQLDNGKFYKRHINQIRTIGENMPITNAVRDYVNDPIAGQTMSTSRTFHNNDELQIAKEKDTHPADNQFQGSASSIISETEASTPPVNENLSDAPVVSVPETSKIIIDSEPPLRRSNRVSRPPIRLNL